MEQGNNISIVNFSEEEKGILKRKKSLSSKSMYFSNAKTYPSPVLGKLGYTFYDVPCEELAKNLLGKVLVRKLKNVLLKGRIVETECYLGGEDKASHSYNGKVTPRNKPMYMRPGTIYVYFTYGMYYCFNISSQGDGAAVLIRAVDPLDGLEFMHKQRAVKRKSSKRKLDCNDCNVAEGEPSVSSGLKTHELCNGPAKLCISFDIDVKKCNMQNLCEWEELWIEVDSQSEEVNSEHIITSQRIGIDSVDAEWAQKPLRFYVYGNKSVSRRDKVSEQSLYKR